MSFKISGFRESLSHETVSEIYEAIQNGDLSRVVLIVLEAMKNQNTIDLYSVVNKQKSEEYSDELRLTANDMYAQKKFQDTLILYNRAILYAPWDTRALKLAMINRSALLFKLKAYRACLREVLRCSTMYLPPHMVYKLRKRREEVNNLVDNDNFNTNLRRKFADLYFQNNFENNSQVHYVSRDVKMVGPITPKILAAKEIYPGTIVCCEKAYVSSTNPANSLIACHYCQKMSLNLIPCNNCCTAMFCNEDCMSTCHEEYHKYECHIIDALADLCENALANLMMKTVFKMRSKCSSWDEIIDESKTFGLDRMKASTNAEIFNSNFVFSVLNVKDVKNVDPELLFKHSIIIAAFLQYVEKVPSFYPENEDEKYQAKEALARIMMFFIVHQSTTYTFQAATNVYEARTQAYPKPNGGIFTFIGKVKKSCTPNLFAVNRNNIVMLMAIQHIHPDEELTLSKPLHWLDCDVEEKRLRFMLSLSDGDACKCLRCTGDESRLMTLSELQMEFCKSVDLNKLRCLASGPQSKEVYQVVLRGMNVLRDVPLSQEFQDFYKIFRKCILFYEAVKGENYILHRF